MGSAQNASSRSAGGKSARGPGRPSDARPRIIIAAGELFAKMGYHGTSMRDISAHGKVPLASITYFFQTKQNLFVECLKESLEVYFNYAEMFAPEPVERSSATASAAIERKILAVYQRFYREAASGQDPWPAAIIVQGVMSRDPGHIGPMAQLIGASKEWFAPRLLKIKPRMNSSEVFAWHTSLWAMISFLTTCRQLILVRLGDRRLTEQTVESFARYTAQVMLKSLKGDTEINLPTLRAMPRAPRDSG